jgi:hypothetical protein
MEKCFDSFDYVITDELGIHARPAGIMAKKKNELPIEVTIEFESQTANKLPPPPAAAPSTVATGQALGCRTWKARSYRF